MFLILQLFIQIDKIIAVYDFDIYNLETPQKK